MQLRREAERGLTARNGGATAHPSHTGSFYIRTFLDKYQPFLRAFPRSLDVEAPTSAAQCPQVRGPSLFLCLTQHTPFASQIDQAAPKAHQIIRCLFRVTLAYRSTRLNNSLSILFFLSAVFLEAGSSHSGVAKKLLLCRMKIIALNDHTQMMIASKN